MKEKEVAFKGKESILNQLREKQAEYLQKIEETEDKARKMSEEIQALIYKNISDLMQNSKGKSNISTQAKSLEHSISKLKKENRDLKESIDAEELKIQDFI